MYTPAQPSRAFETYFICVIMCAKKKANFDLWLTVWLSFERRKIFLEERERDRETQTETETQTQTETQRDRDRQRGIEKVSSHWILTFCQLLKVASEPSNSVTT